MVQACEALSHAHNHGVVHRDIKPSNFVLCTEKGNLILKLVDFGIAKIESSEDQALTKTGEIFGSPLYMSPEQCAGSKEVDSRSDVYSLGCVMYEALAGKPPFSGENALATIVKHLNEKPVSLVVVRKDVKSIDAADKIVMKCLEKRPEDRYPDTLSVRKELESVFLGREFKRKQRGYKPLILTAIAIVLLSVGIPWYQQYQVQAVRQQKKAQYEESIRLCRSGRKHVMESDFDKGLNDFSRSLALGTAAGAPNIYLAYLNSALGNVELRKRNMASGRTYFLKVINFALPPNDRRTVELRYEAYVHLGNDAKYHRHENKEAIPYYKKALLNARLLDKTKFIITMLLELNMLSDAIGDKDAAEAYRKEIENYPKRLDDVAKAIDDFEERQKVYAVTDRMRKQFDKIYAARAFERQKKSERREQDDARERESDHKADLRTEQLKKEWGKAILE
jgi:tetratricopeptide (TPR) repeat protein